MGKSVLVIVGLYLYILSNLALFQLLSHASDRDEDHDHALTYTNDEADQINGLDQRA